MLPPFAIEGQARIFVCRVDVGRLDADKSLPIE
jgi:hypothetical protein